MPEENTVPCSWCGTPTTYTGTKHCDPCHELDKRISDQPELAARMAGYFATKQDVTNSKIIGDVLVGIQKANKEILKGK